MFEVSQVTVRKDLDRLEERGLIRRKRGFASIEGAGGADMRLAYHYHRKRRIAAPGPRAYCGPSGLRRS
ncbi:MAG: DeoR family transcriptional regulator [Spirochaetaceae bacterium]|nr:DeoR family transcriptional regulator [Spirochaetaceae bacterium]